MKIRIIALLMAVTAWTAFCQIGRVSNITCDIARNSTYSCRFTSMMDGAVTANILRNSSDFDVSGWTGLFFIGDGRGGMVVTNTAREFSSFTFSIPVSSIPTNGTYYSQLIGYQNGRIEEWGRGIVVVENNYSDWTLPTEWIREHPIYQIATQALNVANSAYQLVAGQSNMFWAIVSSIPAGSITSNDVTRWNQAYASSTNIPELANGLTNLVSQSISTQRMTRVYNPANSSEWSELHGNEKLTYSCFSLTNGYNFYSKNNITYTNVIPPLAPNDSFVFISDDFLVSIASQRYFVGTNDVISIYVYDRDNLEQSQNHNFPISEDLAFYDGSTSAYIGTLYLGVTVSTNLVVTDLADKNDISAHNVSGYAHADIRASITNLPAQSRLLIFDQYTNVVWQKIVSNGWEYLVAQTNYVGGAQ